MEECQECQGNINDENECTKCGCSVEISLFVSVIKTMSDKVKTYKEIMQERLQIIREDIISSITEETVKYQKLLDSSINILNTYMTELSELEFEGNETKPIINPDVIIDSLEINNVNFNMDAEKIHEAFMLAMKGEFVLFRQVFRDGR
jgi:hypothetical protein